MDMTLASSRAVNNLGCNCMHLFSSDEIFHNVSGKELECSGWRSGGRNVFEQKDYRLLYESYIL